MPHSTTSRTTGRIAPAVETEISVDELAHVISLTVPVPSLPKGRLPQAMRQHATKAKIIPMARTQPVAIASVEVESEIEIPTEVANVAPVDQTLAMRMNSDDFLQLSEEQLSPYVDLVNETQPESRAALYRLLMRAVPSDPQQLKMVEAADGLPAPHRNAALAAMTEVFGRLQPDAMSALILLARGERNDELRRELVLNLSSQIPEIGAQPGDGDNLAQAAIGIIEDRARYSALSALSHMARLCGELDIVIFSDRDVTRMTSMLKLLCKRLTPKSPLLSAGVEINWFG